MPVFAQEQRQCIANQICLMPHDYLKYFGSGFGKNATTTFTFGEMIDPSTIKVNTSIDNGTRVSVTNSILNLKDNTLTDSDGKHGAFIFMAPIPLDPQMVSSSPNEETVNFNGFTRDAFGLHEHNETTTNDFDVDKETGILLYFGAFNNEKLFNKTVTLGFSTKLLDTNIITSSNSNSTIVTSPSYIPKWIKNNAEWWSQGSIEDSDFIKGIQYLIQQGIIKIPDTHKGTSSTDKIPHWIKTDAGLWAANQISDDDFVKAIQYLIINGIINP